MKRGILLVDDHKIVREGLRSLLDREPDLVVVGEAEDAASLWDQLAKASPEIVVMDICLRDLDGIELSRQILSRFPELKIVVLSAFPDRKWVDEALRVGVRGYLLKANPAAELLWAIRAVLAGKVYLCPDVANPQTAPPPVSPSLGVLSEPLAPAQPSPSPRLSERELEVLRLTAGGLRTKQIAQQLNIGVRTAETYRARLMRKLHCNSNVELTRYAIRTGIASV